MKKIYLAALVFIMAQWCHAQAVMQDRHKLAVFTPLYLDDAFTPEGDYKYGDNDFPKIAIAGLEFYQGVAIALDSLNEAGVPLDAYIYDSKAAAMPVDKQFAEAAANGVELVIANGSLAEMAQYARLAQQYKIPVINANVPNEAGIKGNPYFVIINPTLLTQVEGMYDYIKNKYSGSPVVFLTKNDTNESYIRSLFQAIDKSRQAIGMVKYIPLTDSTAIAKAVNTAGSTAPAVFVGGTLSLTTGGEMIAAAAAAKPPLAATILGMPTWEEINFSKPEYKGINITYGTPFYNPKTDNASRNIIAYYNSKLYARPSDLVFRAYGLTYHFGRLLQEYGNHPQQYISSKAYKVFYDYDIQPVRTAGGVNYFENKKVYFISYLNGALREVY